MAAIRRVDPAAMVSTNVFTFWAVHRSGPAKLRSDQTADRRFPALSLALTKSRLSYLDVHLYSAGDDNDFQKDLASIEFDRLRQACRETGKPLIMGEFGSLKKTQKTISEASAAVVDLLRKAVDHGFTGFLYWTYDDDDEPTLWNGKSEHGEIFEALSKARPWQ
jgi:hypothetical protein